MTERNQFRFFHPLRVRWGECDAQGIVFNVNYFLYFDVAMTEYMRGHDVTFVGNDALEFYTVKAESNFRGSAVFDDMLDIGVRCQRIGTTSITYAFGIFRGDDLLNDGALTYVHAVHGTKEKAPVPQSFVDRLTAFETLKPERK